MKKFLAIALIAATFAACNDAKKEETTTTTDSTAVTPAPAPATGDTVKAVVVDTTAKPAAADTTKH